MKFLFSGLLAVMFTTSTSAQIRAALYPGLTVSRVSIPSAKRDNVSIKNRTGRHLGLSLQPVPNYRNFLVDIAIAQRGFESDAAGDDVMGFLDAGMSMTYLEVAALGKFRLATETYIEPHGIAGVTFGRRIGCSVSANIEGDDDVAARLEVDCQDLLKDEATTDLGAVLGVGLDTMLSENVFFSFQTLVSHSLRDIELRGEEPSDGDTALKHRALTIRAGVGMVFGN